MSREFFRNAPLVEVIAEIRWAVTPVKAVPNGGIDPFFESIRASLEELLSKEGYGSVTETVPQEVPREFLAGQVTTQYRTAPNRWPLYQLGPGIFTANITEGYNGWGSFQPHLCRGIELLIETHPAPKLFDIQSLKLIAIDAFGGIHNFSSYNDFTREMLPLNQVLQPQFLDAFALSRDSVAVRSESTFPLREMPDSLARISFAEGLKDDKPALLVHTTVEKNGQFQPDANEVKGWFDDAHKQHREMFRKLLSPELYQILRPEGVQS